MHLLYDAIKGFEQENGELPSSISELVPEYLADPGLLSCPHAKESGVNSSVGARLNSIVDLSDGVSSYPYEFSDSKPVSHRDRLGVLRKAPFRDFKEKQVSRVGGVVPIVRCFFHDPILNLGLDGKIYESSLYWESNFRHKVPLPYLLADLLMEFPEPVGERLADLDLSSYQVDLSERFNALLSDPWLTGSGASPLGIGLPETMQVEKAVFDTRGAVQLEGKGFARPSYPDSSPAFKIGKAATKIEFLHACAFESEPATKVAEYLVRFDGHAEVVSIPIRYGKEIASFSGELDPTAALPARLPEFRENCRLFVFEWANPKANRKIESIEFKSSGARSAPFLVAINLDAHNEPQQSGSDGDEG